MIPETPEEMTAVITNSVIADLYVRITTEARKRRLTEHDIAVIERRAIEEWREAKNAAHEFTTYEAEPAILQGLKHVEDFTAGARAQRIKAIQQK